MANLSKLKLSILIKAIVGVIGFVSALIGIYAFYNSNKTQVQYQVLTNTNVFDINADLSKLDIEYSGTSLKSNNQSLRVMTIKIKNTGNENILKSSYDSSDPLGLFIQKGEIIESPELTSASNSYLKKNLKINLNSLGTLLFNQIILEKNESFTVKILVLCRDSDSPQIVPIGKIAGLNKIPVINYVQDSQQKSFFTELFEGGLIIQLVRFLIYFIVSIFILVWLIKLLKFLVKKEHYFLKKKLVKNFKASDLYIQAICNEPIFTKFLKRGNSRLKYFKEHLQSQEKLQQLYKEYTKYHPPSDTIQDLLNDGYVKIENDSFVPNQQMLETLQNFLSYLKESQYTEQSMFWI